MGNLASILKGLREVAIPAGAIGALLDSLRTNHSSVQECVDGAMFMVNEWSCHVRINEQGLCTLTVMPAQKQLYEHATQTSEPCSIAEVTSLVRSMTSTAPIRREMHKRLTIMSSEIAPHKER